MRRSRIKWPWRIVYTGSVDELGRPHGFGFWKGDLTHGETLVGFWSDGLPSGPYKSREVATGSGFMCIRVGFARCQMGDKPILFGICNVECSVSGRFFRGFPKTEMVEAPQPDEPLSRGLKKRLELMMSRTRHVVNRRGTNSFFLERKTSPVPTRTRSGGAIDTRTKSVLLLPKTHDRAAPGSCHVSSTMSLDLTGTVSDLMLDDEDYRQTHRPQGPMFYTLGLKEKFLQRNYVESINWLLKQLHPHTPTFGVQPRSEIVVSVDRERGVDIMGFVPLSQIVIEDDEGGPIKNPKEADVKDPHSTRTTLPSTSLERNQAPMTVQFKITEKSLMEVETNPENLTTDEKFAARVDLFAPELIVDGWISMEAIGISEVLLYVHGYNNSQSEAIKTLGQMAAFGNFPSHLKILVFSWPAGSGLFSFSTAKGHAEDPSAHQAFRDVLVALREEGIRQIHILCHSMGARLFLKSMQNVFKEKDVVARLHTGHDLDQTFIEEEVQGKLQILTCTFLNPEYHLDDFVNIDYPDLRQHCAHITIYADGNDKALWWCEFFSRREALGRSVFGLRANRQPSAVLPQPAPNEPPFEMIPEEPQDLLDRDSQTDSPLMCSPHHQTETTTAAAADTSSPQVAKSDLPRLRFMHTVSFFQMEDHRDTHEIIDIDSPPTTTTCKRRWGGKASREALAAAGDWLDLDIIDTTFMDQNVHGLRHSFWNLNREIIEDLRELLITRKRARQRTGRLDRRDGNVWVFRVAPSFLTSIFDTPY